MRKTLAVVADGHVRAGAMRQWGMQATAFVGRRHFDAPDLFDTRFFRNRAPLP